MSMRNPPCLAWSMAAARRDTNLEKELDPRLLHIRGIDLVIKGWSEDPLIGLYALPK